MNQIIIKRKINPPSPLYVGAQRPISFKVVHQLRANDSLELICQLNLIKVVHVNSFLF